MTASNDIVKVEERRLGSNDNRAHHTASTSDYRKLQTTDVVTTVNTNIVLPVSLSDVLLHADEFPHPPEGEPETLSAAQSRM